MVVDALKEAEEAIRTMWTGLCRVFGFEESEDKYGVTIHTELTLLENLPCRLSFKNISMSFNISSNLGFIKLLLSFKDIFSLFLLVFLFPISPMSSS